MEGAEFEKMSKPPKLDQKQLFENLAKDLHELVTNKQALDSSVKLFLDNIIDEITQGIIFDVHRKFKTNAYDLDANKCDEVHVDFDLDDSNPQQKQKKAPNFLCVCPSCKRTVATSRFAPHLEACMGLGRTNRSCSASRRIASNGNNSSDKEAQSSQYCGGVTKDDASWGSSGRRKRKRDEGSKKGKGAKKYL